MVENRANQGLGHRYIGCAVGGEQQRGKSTQSAAQSQRLPRISGADDGHPHKRQPKQWWQKNGITGHVELSSSVLCGSLAAA